MRSAPAIESRLTCPRCRQPATGCWCAELSPRRTRAKFVLLQHPREARNPVGTARMAHLALEGSRLLIGIDFARSADFRTLLEEERDRSVVLFPGEGARDARELAARSDPPTIWLIDGTWAQAQKIWKTNPLLRALPAYRIEPRRPSQYTFRSEPEPHCISTIEAVAELLDVVEGAGEAGYEEFLAPFKALVARQVSHANGPGRAPRRRSHPRPPRPFRLPGLLAERPEDAVVVHAEGNGWPASLEPRPETELLQVTAIRVGTGESLSLFVRPTRGLSPTTLPNQGLAETDLEGWIEPGALPGRWRAFARSTDVYCGWGHLTALLLARTGVALPNWADLRAPCNRVLRERSGRIEDGHRKLELPAIAPRFPGRGGRRAQMLEAIVRALVGRAQ